MDLSIFDIILLSTPVITIVFLILSPVFIFKKGETKPTKIRVVFGVCAALVYFILTAIGATAIVFLMYYINVWKVLFALTVAYFIIIFNALNLVIKRAKKRNFNVKTCGIIGIIIYSTTFSVTATLNIFLAVFIRTMMSI